MITKKKTKAALRLFPSKSRQEIHQLSNLNIKAERIIQSRIFLCETHKKIVSRDLIIITERKHQREI
jgi:hypothetical protein